MIMLASKDNPEKYIVELTSLTAAMPTYATSINLLFARKLLRYVVRIWPKTSAKLAVLDYLLVIRNTRLVLST